MPIEHHVIAFIERMRANGARVVRVGEIVVEFGPAPASAQPAQKPETAEERRARLVREQEEYDRVLFHSAG